MAPLAVRRPHCMMSRKGNIRFSFTGEGWKTRDAADSEENMNAHCYEPDERQCLVLCTAKDGSYTYN